MLNMSPKTIIIFTLGAVVGAIAAVITVTDKYEKMLDDEIEAYKEYVAERHRPIKDDRKENSVTEETYAEALANIDNIVNSDNSKNKVLRMQKDRYKKVARMYGTINEDQSEQELAEMEHPEDDETDAEETEEMDAYNGHFGKEGIAPYLISIEQFSEEEEDFDKITIYYYDKDEALVDEDEEVISDIEGTVGKENLNSFGEAGTVDPYTIYVRNEKLEIDYEVICLQKSYTEDVLGFNEEHGNKGPRRLRRREYDDQ